MRILYFSKASEIGPSSRYRIFQYLPYLHSRDVDVVVRPLFGPTYFWLLTWRILWLKTIAKTIYTLARFLKRGTDLLSIGAVDLIVIEGQLFPYLGPIVERILSKRHKVVIELDDAIYLTYRHERKIPAILRVSQGAIVGNATLARYARSYTPNVHIVPTVVDTERFRPVQASESRSHGAFETTIMIGWIGLAYNLPFLEWLAPVFREIHEKCSVCVRVISSRPLLLNGVNVDFKSWRYETEVEDLRGCHIGVMPLPDNEWAKGKCGLKLLQYMAVGLPAIASPIGVNREIIFDGKNGYLALTQEEWYEKLLTLCRDPELRANMGRAAVRTVQGEYSLSVWGPRLADCYYSILNDQTWNRGRT